MKNKNFFVEVDFTLINYKYRKYHHILSSILTATDKNVIHT